MLIFLFCSLANFYSFGIITFQISFAKSAAAIILCRTYFLYGSGSIPKHAINISTLTSLLPLCFTRMKFGESLFDWYKIFKTSLRTEPIPNTDNESSNL
jgi:hypothetical protein